MEERFSETDIYFMRQALKEARKGLGRTSPNPCVGTVIVNNGEIVARGHHKKAGEAHAEIIALIKAGDKARGADMYITLEPCNHTGRTGPCSRAVVESGIKNVRIGMLDPNPLVDGSGAHYLANAGIDVKAGLLEAECRQLNRPFLTYITKGRPWVVMKAGMTLDGKITLRENYGDVITGPESFRQVHTLRDRCDAILVGIDTVRIDNPSLTTRLVGRRGRNPVRVILDSNLKISPEVQVISQSRDGLTWIFCSQSVDFKKVELLKNSGVLVFQTSTEQSGRLDLKEVMMKLASRQITSVLVEGGAAVHGSFLKAGLVDHVKLFYAPVFGGDGGVNVIRDYRINGTDKDMIRLDHVKHRRFGEDLMISGDVVRKGPRH